MTNLAILMNGDEYSWFHYRICAYANDQYDLSSDIDANPDNTAFRKAMRLARGTLLMLDSNIMPFRRIWCDFELAKTLEESASTYRPYTERSF